MEKYEKWDAATSTSTQWNDQIQDAKNWIPRADRMILPQKKELKIFVLKNLGSCSMYYLPDECRDAFQTAWKVSYRGPSL